MEPVSVLLHELNEKDVAALPDGTLVSPPLEDLAPFLPEEELREYLHFREAKQLEHGEAETVIQELNDLSLTVMSALGKATDGAKVRILDEEAAMKALQTAKSIFLR